MGHGSLLFCMGVYLVVTQAKAESRNPGALGVRKEGGREGGREGGNKGLGLTRRALAKIIITHKPHNLILLPSLPPSLPPSPGTLPCALHDSTDGSVRHLLRLDLQ